MPSDFCTKIMENMSSGKAQIVKEELDLNDTKPGKPTLEAQRKITLLARRLEREGQIQIPQMIESQGGGNSRYGGNSLLSSIKLPAGLKLDGGIPPIPQEAEIVNPTTGSIQDKLRQFMNKSSQTSKERFPDINDNSDFPKE
jgi:hypothetical protein